MIIVFDTETTGKVDFKAHYSAEHQPRIVQLGAQLIDDTDEWKVRGEINLIIKPDGWTISKEVSDIHGITDDIANKSGVEEKVALKAFTHLVKQAKILVAHNINFDRLMVCGQLNRHSSVVTEEIWKMPNFCTMDATTNLCKLPGHFGKYKWPKLTEAYEFLFKETFGGAHDAMADVRACARIYKWLKTQSK